MADWRETLRRLTQTSPAPGIEIVNLPVESFRREMVGAFDLYIRRQVAVHCDPDVLEQTTRKNAELMATLSEVEKKLASGKLVEVKEGEIILLPLTEEELRHLINDAIFYIRMMRAKNRDKKEFGYFERIDLYEKLMHTQRHYELSHKPVCNENADMWEGEDDAD